MTDINTCPCCENPRITELEEKLYGISFRYKIKCLTCGYTIEKQNKRVAYKTWEMECKDNAR